MAETELSMLTKQCLDRRIADRETLIRETEARPSQRNGQQATINWQFTTTLARVKLKRLYLSLQL
jgi:hypothetical protein